MLPPRPEWALSSGSHLLSRLHAGFGVLAFGCPSLYSLGWASKKGQCLTQNADHSGNEVGKRAAGGWLLGERTFRMPHLELRSN